MLNLRKSHDLGHAPFSENLPLGIDQLNCVTDLKSLLVVNDYVQGNGKYFKDQVTQTKPLFGKKLFEKNYLPFVRIGQIKLNTKFEVFSFTVFSDVHGECQCFECPVTQATSLWGKFLVILFKFCKIEHCAKYQVAIFVFLKAKMCITHGLCHMICMSTYEIRNNNIFAITDGNTPKMMRTERRKRINDECQHANSPLGDAHSLWRNIMLQ